MANVPSAVRLASSYEARTNLAAPGKVPARSIDAFSDRLVYASTISGVKLDCDLYAGTKVGGGTPTDNLAPLNGVLATATAANPVTLVIDGGAAVGGALVGPATGHWSILGQGRRTGFYWLPGSNSSQIQTSNVGTTDLQHAQALSTGALAGSNVRLSNFYLNCNRGTYPNGLVNKTSPYAGDGSIPGGTSVDARGYLDWYWFTSVLLCGIEDLEIDHLKLFDAPTYGIHLVYCQKFWVHHNRIDAGNPAFNGNTDAIHLNSGCKYFWIDHNYGSVGDDFIAINSNEGNAEPITDGLITNNHSTAGHNGVRVHGKQVRTERITIGNITASGNRARAVLIGDESGAPSATDECNGSIRILNIDFQATSGAVAPIYINGNVGHLEISSVNQVEPTQALPTVQLGSQCRVSHLALRDCAIHRNEIHSAAAYLLQGASSCRIGSLSVEGVSVTEQVGHTYPDIPRLIDLTGTTVGQVAIDAEVHGVATVLNIPASATVGNVAIKDLTHTSNAGSPGAYSIVAGGAVVPVSVGRYTPGNLAGLASGNVTLTGPGLAGLAMPDALVGDGWPYYSAAQLAPAIKLGGAIRMYTMAAASTLTPGVVTAGATTASTAAATATEATLGTGPYTHQWYRSTASGTLGSAVPGQTTLTLADTGLATGTTYFYTLRYTDAASAVVSSNPVGLTTTSVSVTVLADTFTGTAGTSLVGHVPAPTQLGSIVWANAGVGTPWVFATGGIGITQGTLGGTFIRYDLTGISPRCKVQFTFQSTSGASGLLVQLNRKNDPNFDLINFQFSSSVGLGKYLATVPTGLADNPAPVVVAGTVHPVTITLTPNGAGGLIFGCSINGSPLTAVGGTFHNAIDGFVITDAVLQSPAFLVLGAIGGSVGDALIRNLVVSTF